VYGMKISDIYNILRYGKMPKCGSFTQLCKIGGVKSQPVRSSAANRNVTKIIIKLLTFSVALTVTMIEDNFFKGS